MFLVGMSEMGLSEQKLGKLNSKYKRVRERERDTCVCVYVLKKA